MTPRPSLMTPRLNQSPRWPKVESITTHQLHYCWDKRPPLYKQLWFRALGSRQDSTALDETWALARASNKPLYAFALLWTSYSLSFGDSDSGHNILLLIFFFFNLLQSLFLYVCQTLSWDYILLGGENTGQWTRSGRCQEKGGKRKNPGHGRQITVFSCLVTTYQVLLSFISELLDWRL